MNPFSKLIRALIFAGFAASAFAQEVTIPDTNLNAVVRTTLQKPNGPLTEQDMLGLINLSAGSKQITDVGGLEAARNLSILDLDLNLLTNFSIGGALTNLTIIDLFENHLTNLDLSTCSTKLTIIDGSFNSIAQCFLPDGLTNLDTLFLDGNGLTNFALPAGLSALTQLALSQNALASLTVRPDMTNLTTLSLFANQLTNLTLPPNLSRLTGFDADINHLTRLDLPAGLSSLLLIIARDNQLTNITIRPDMTNLTFVDLDGNQLSNFTLPEGLRQMNFLRLPNNKLTSFSLPPGLTNLESLFLQNNQLTNISFSSGIKQLVQIDVRSNNLASLTLPPDMTNLTTLVVDANPLTNIVMSEPLALKLGATVTALRNQGVNVFTYPLTVQLVRARQLPGAVQFGITGPPGVYTIFQSTNLASWSVLDSVSMPLGAVSYTDESAHFYPQRFYRALLQSPASALTNMVFIAPNTFTLGSPTNEIGHQADESPQTTVTLTHGFWMSKFLVTQRDYLAVTGTNPSGFPGDLDRPVESVSWFAATNYCDTLTQQDLASGRIPPGSHYRLPTEAEWECAARAGTTTRFYFGDDATSLTNYAWYSANSGFGTHPVGLKQPNAWGLYDMEGNVWEWCEDWYGPYPGGAVTDPQGPPSNSIGFKVIRGGAWESFELDCRSARRSIEGASPFISDFIIGFRVVLTFEP